MIAQEEAQGKPGQSGQPPPPPQQPQIPPEMMQQMQQMQQEFQQLQQENAQLKSGTMQKQQAAEMDASIKERTSMLDADVRKFIAELQSRTTLQAKAMDIEAQFILKGAEQAAQPEPVVAEADQMAQGAEQQPALADVMAMVGQLADKVGKMSSAKRQHKFIMDGQGNIIGGESTLVGPDTVQ